MGRLLLLFIFGFIGLSLRYIILGEFELDQLLILFLFPLAAVIILFIMKWKHNKDRDFQPNLNNNNFVTRLSDKVSSTTKQIYRGKDHIGSYNRFYDTWWKRVVANVMETPGLWYLNLSFTFLEGDRFIFQEINEHKLLGNNEWVIYRNNSIVGTVETDQSLRNTAKLKEVLFLEFGKHSYQFRSHSLNSKTEILLNDTIIATGTRVGASVYELAFHSTQNDDAELLFMVNILFNYRYGRRMQG